MHADDPRDYEEAERQEALVVSMEATRIREMERILSDPVVAQKKYRDIILHNERNRIWGNILKYLNERDYVSVENMIFNMEGV